jgi:hypothetical protein
MDEWLSPNFKHDKLEAPTFGDLVDVFEDLWLNHIFNPVAALLEMPHGDIAAMLVLSSYYEAIESLCRGESSKNKSKEFFVAGFRRIFNTDHPGIEKAASAIYEHVRCGLAHEGMLTYKVQYSRAAQRAFLLTYPKRVDGSLNIEAEVTSIVVNPVRIFQGTRLHFIGYVSSLRQRTDASMCEAFEASVTRLWALGQGDLVIGATEATVFGGF